MTLVPALHRSFSVPTATGRFQVRGISAVLLASLAGLLLLVHVAVFPEWWYSAQGPPRSFTRVPLRQVLANLEATGVIPKGTEWTESTLRNNPVTASFWFLPPVRVALTAIANSGHVVLEVPWESNCFGGGRVVGPLRVHQVKNGQGAGLVLIRPAPRGSA